MVLRLSDLRAQNYSRPEPPIYRYMRPLTIRLTRLVSGTGITPNQITLLSFAAGIAAAALAAAGQTALMPAAGAALFLSYLLDCMDGELARATAQSSRLGNHLENLSNWLLIGLLQIGAAAGAFRQTGEPVYLLAGMASLFGWYGFYYLFIQLQDWLSGRDGFNGVRRLSRLLIRFMPIDENLFLAFALTAALPALVLLSAALSILLFGTTLLLFLAPAVIQHRQGHF